MCGGCQPGKGDSHKEGHTQCIISSRSLFSDTSYRAEHVATTKAPASSSASTDAVLASLAAQLMNAMYMARITGMTQLPTAIHDWLALLDAASRAGSASNANNALEAAEGSFGRAVT